MATLNSVAIQEAVARARAKMALQQAEKDRKAGKHLLLNLVVPAPRPSPILAVAAPKQEAVEADPMDSYMPALPYTWLDGKEPPAESTQIVLRAAEVTPIQFLGASTPTPIPTAFNNTVSAWLWNDEQAAAIEYGMARKSFCLIGAAGTGKTTNLKGILREMIKHNLIAPLDSGTANLSHGAPGVVLVSYTRRAVRNISKQMPPDLRGHCLTIHKLLEFAPEFYEADLVDEDGHCYGSKTKMRFSPSRNSSNPLPRNLRTIVIDEASMVSIELFEQLWDALPNPHNVQFLVLGDLNQLPPVYGQAILGKMLLEKPIIELTKVYRQALESPIISIALAVKDNNFKTFNSECADGTFKVSFRTVEAVLDSKGKPKKDAAGRVETRQVLTPFDPVKHKVDVRDVPATGGQIIIEREGRGKVTLHPWKQKLEQDDALTQIKGQINHWITTGEYLPDEDLILCPWNESFGTIELNKSIANKLGKMRNAEVYEVIAGFNKLYLAVGDKLLVDKQEATILKIEKNPKYMGKRPGPHSQFLDRWGCYQKTVTQEIDDFDLSNQDIDDLLSSAADIEDRTSEASHVVRLHFLDTDEEIPVSKASTLNTSTFGYAITVHKAQGSECRKIFFLTHYCHSAMLMRELVYTAITRAAEELYIIMSPKMLQTAASRPRIKGDTLGAKLAWYTEKLKERMS